MSGVTLRMVDEQTAGFLKSRGIAAGAASVTSIVVDSDRRGIASVTVRVQVPAGEAARAAARSRRPRSGPSARAGAADAQLRGDRRNDRRPARRRPLRRPGVVRRAGLNARTLTPPIDPDELASDSPGERGRPAEGRRGIESVRPHRSVFARGWLGDAYTDLIPDRAETPCSWGRHRFAGRRAHRGADWTGDHGHHAAADEHGGQGARRRARAEPDSRGPRSSAGRRPRQGRQGPADRPLPGEGLVQTIPRAFGNATATVVVGADAAAPKPRPLPRKRAPYVWDNTRGSIALERHRDRRVAVPAGAERRRSGLAGHG